MTKNIHLATQSEKLVQTTKEVFQTLKSEHVKNMMIMCQKTCSGRLGYAVTRVYGKLRHRRIGQRRSGTTGCSKHKEACQQICQDCVCIGQVRIEKIDTRTRVSDFGTMALDQRRFHELVRLLSVGRCSDLGRETEQRVGEEEDNTVDCIMSATDSQHIENVQTTPIVQEVPHNDDMLGMCHIATLACCFAPHRQEHHERDLRLCVSKISRFT